MIGAGEVFEPPVGDGLGQERDVFEDIGKGYAGGVGAGEEGLKAFDFMVELGGEGDEGGGEEGAKGEEGDEGGGCPGVGGFGVEFEGKGVCEDSEDSSPGDIEEVGFEDKGEGEKECAGDEFSGKWGHFLWGWWLG